MLVESVSQVHHGALADPAHEIRREVGKESLQRVQQDDERPHQAEVHVLDQDVVEDGLDEIGEPGGGRAVAEHAENRDEKTAAVGPGLGKEAPQLAQDSTLEAMLSGLKGPDRPREPRHRLVDAVLGNEAER